MYTLREIAGLWRISFEQARRLFAGRAVNVAGPNSRRPSWRVPVSVARQVMTERGYKEEQPHA